MEAPAQGEDVDVTWEQARAINLANWNDRVPIHRIEYGTDAFDRDPARLTQVVSTDLKALERHLPNGMTGLDLCHLQCHIGTDTVSLARAGARVTGIDFSAPALEEARELAHRLGINATWIESDVMDARAAVDAAMSPDTHFDIVYTSIGAIGWLKDLAQWARQIHALLRPGGVFYIRDGHPAMLSLDEEADGLVTAYRYFADGRAQVWTSETSYLGDTKLAHPQTYEYPHPISEIITVLLDAGLVIRAFDEGDTLPWKFSEHMVELPDTDFALPEHQRALMPLTFTVVATKPE
jgi:2-polyprenyl-3-methyl-5-hydroxy-6-metoxy-1,4-benzoquinol methylase